MTTVTSTETITITEADGTVVEVSGPRGPQGATGAVGAAGADADVSALLVKANDLSDLASASTARTNLGLGTMATATATDYLTKAGNLAGLADLPTARTNLGLGTAAVADTGTGAGTVAAGDDSRFSDARTPTDGSVSTVKIADGAVTDAKLASQKAPRTALWLPGTSGNYVSCPDAAALRITGDIDIRWVGSLNDWTTVGVYPTFVSKYVSPQRGFMFGMFDDKPYLEWDTDGAGGDFTKLATVAPTVADGGILGVRVTLDVDNGAGGHDVKFYTSADYGVTWTQLGATVTTAGTTSIYAGTAPLLVGATSSSLYLLPGRTLKAEVRNGIGGTVVASPDFTAPNGPRHRDAQGNIWTINGSAWAWELA